MRSGGVSSEVPLSDLDGGLSRALAAARNPRETSLRPHTARATAYEPIAINASETTSDRPAPKESYDGRVLLKVA
jgi:hypothetical protein